MVGSRSWGAGCPGWAWWVVGRRGVGGMSVRGVPALVVADGRGGGLWAAGTGWRGGWRLGGSAAGGATSGVGRAGWFDGEVCDMSDGSGDVLVRCAAVTRTFGRGAQAVRAVRDVHATVTIGDRIAVVGRSGSGKSTLLHLMGGLDTPTTGMVS